MSKLFAIVKRELLSFFVSPIAYFIIMGFTLLSGYFFFSFLSAFSEAYQRSAMFGQAPPNLNQIVDALYQTLLVVLVFFIPLLTMRTLADEKSKGTFELLITSPVSIFDVVVGKFIALGLVVLLMLGLAALFPLLLCVYGKPEVAPIVSGFFGVALYTLAFISLSMAVSSFTENQVVAGVSSMVLLLLLFMVERIAGGAQQGLLFSVAQHLSPYRQASVFIMGIVSLKATVYFVSLIVLGLFVSQRALEAYRWR
jgi:ABC-2 type transport system permease protein